MNKYLLTLLSALMITLAGTASFAQSGEVNRFKNESLEPKTNVIKLFPNPTIDFITVSIDNATLAKVGFTVHNIIGNVVYSEIEKVGEQEYKINVKDLPPGYYLLAIRDEQGYFKETYKFLKR